jgi:3-hydroxyisobutyrate dehydrogenase-like beta-hydroxyacid dehydrogenase
MVANDKQPHDVIERPALLDKLKRGSVIAIASSCSPETCKELAKAAAPNGIGFVDVPLVLGQEA